MPTATTEPAEPSYFVESRWGGVEAEPPRSRMKKILEALSDADAEHQDPSLGHESGWTLSVTARGEVVWANEEQRFAPRHLLAVSPEEMLRLWCDLAQGELERLEREPWRYGLPPVAPPRNAPHRDLTQRWLVGLSVALAPIWLGAAIALVVSNGRSFGLLLLPVAACSPPLFVGVVLTAIVRANVARGWHRRDRRIARACYVLASVLAATFALTTIVVVVSELPDDPIWRSILATPWLLLPEACAVLVCGLCFVAPALIVGLLAAERAKHADE